LETYAPGVEKRRDTDVSVLTLTWRVMPFNSTLAAALDQGLGDSSNIKQTIFQPGTGQPKPAFTRHDFTLGLTSQNLELFPSPDSKARLSLLQCRVRRGYVRTQKDNNDLAFVFRTTFGPVGRDELEYIHSLHRRQVFITFTPGEPLLDSEETAGDDVEDD